MAQIVVWGTGGTTEGRFKPQKTVASAAIVQVPAAIKVNWGGGDVVLLSGSSWSLSTLQSWVACAFGLFSFNNILKQTFCNSGQNVPDLVIYDSAKFTESGARNSTGTQTVKNGFRVGLTYTNGAIQYLTGGQNFAVNLFHKSYCNWGSCTVSGITRAFGIGMVDFQQTSKKVTTNTNATSERITTIDPIVSTQTQGWAITVTYSDNTNIQIALSFAPSWVRIEDDQSCPAGSCECVHDGYKCCIDPASGVVVKKIRL